jgi:hypothetical protein
MRIYMHELATASQEPGSESPDPGSNSDGTR